MMGSTPASISLANSSSVLQADLSSVHRIILVNFSGKIFQYIGWKGHQIQGKYTLLPSVSK